MKIKVKVCPRSSQNKIEKISEEEYKIKITAAPVDGEANKATIKMLAEYFGISKGGIKIIRGKASRSKLIEI